MDHREEFAAKVDDLTKTVQPLPWRRRAVEGLIQEYIETTGERPDREQLFKLANHLLADELKDKSPDKVTRAEFPILSFYQMRTRDRRERRVGDDRLDTLKLKQKKRLRYLSSRKPID